MKDKEKTKNQPISEPIKKKEILIVEDERVVVKDIKMSIQKLGYAVSGVAITGEDAVKKAEELNPDLVLMDIVVEGKMNGIKAAEIIHSRFNIPVVYLTAYSDNKTLERAIQTEPFGYILKPFEDRDLSTTIEMALYKHKTEEVLRESEEKLRVMFESIKDGIVVTDLEGNIIEVNDAILRMGGYSHKKELIGRNAIDFVSPNDQAKAKENMSKELEVGHSIGNVEYALLAKDGSEFDVESNATILRDGSGNSLGLINVIRDITKRKKAEEELKESEEFNVALFEHNPIQTIAVDNSGRVTNFNMAKKTSGDRLPNIGDVMYKDYAGKHEIDMHAELMKCIKSKKAKRFPEMKYRDKYLDITLAPFPKGAIITTQDITERKYTEKIQASLYKISEATHAAENPEKLYHIIHEIIAEQMPAKNNFYIALYDKASGMISFPYFVDEYEESPEPRKFGKGLTEYVIRTGKPLLASPKVYDKLEKKDEVVSIGPPSIDWLGVPLKTKEGTIGAMVVQSYTEGIRYKKEDKDILTFVSEQVAIAIERKRAEEALQKREIRLREVFEQSQDVLYKRNLKTGQYEYMSPAITQITGYTPDELIRMTPEEIEALTHPEDIGRISDIRRTLLKSPQGDKTVSPIEYRVKGKDGRYRWISDNFTLIRSPEGHPLFSIASVRDITERKQVEEILQMSEERYRALFEQAADSIVLVDGETGALAEFNDRAYENLGYTRKEFEKLKIPDFEIIESPEEVKKHIKKIIKEGSASFETKHKTKEGKIRNIHVTSRAIAIRGKNFVQSIWCDITERKQTEEALKESEKRFKTVISNVPIIIWALDKEGKFTLSEGLGLKALGLKPGEVVGKSIFEVYRDVPKILEDNYRALAGESFVSFVEVGKLVFASYYSSVRDSKGEVIGMIGVSTDISEQRMSEQLLRESEERYRDLVEKAGIGILIDDREGNVKYLNKKYMEMLKYSRKEMKKLSIKSVVHPDDVDRVLKYHKNRIQGRRTPSRYEFRAIRKDGSTIHLEVDAIALRENGKITGSRSYIWDITERKKAEEALRESEEKFRSLAEKLPNMIFIYKKNRIIYANKRCEEAIGYKREEFYSPDFSFFRLIAPESVDLIKSKLKKHMDGKEVKPYEYSLITKDGKRIDVINATKLINYEGDNAILGVVTDITERKRAHEELKASREQLRNLAAHLQTVREGERTSIAREIHDDLGQTLTALKMDLSLLTPKLPKDQKSLLKRTESMSKLIDSTIQTVQRISAELRPGVLDDIGLTAALEWQGDEFQKRTGIKCELTIEPEDIFLDKDLSTAIFRIFQETLTNVARHSKAKWTKVNLKKRARKIELIVRDNGKGITKEQISNSKSFGLIGIRERVQYFGGEVEIKGIQNRGTTLKAWIPLPKDKKN